jgi:signal transduction histidine kinase
VRLEVERVDVTAMVRQVVLLFGPQAGAKGLELRVHVPEGLSIYSDPAKLFQVFSNLVGNAVKFTDHGHVEVTVTPQAGYIECLVQDTGRGISKEDLPRLFGKFQQAGKLLSGRDRGMGLGLTITKDIIELHKGSIHIESELGKGSKFTFTLPRDPRSEPS